MYEMSTRPEHSAFAGFTEQWVRGFANAVMAAEAELTALDQQVGDGDFGTNLAAGLQATLRRLAVLPAGPPPATAAGRTPLRGRGRTPLVRSTTGAQAARPLKAAADAFLDEVGGTSGPLFGLLFQELAAAVLASRADALTAALAAGVGNGLAAIHRVGEAEVGDRTLVDALAPAAAALSATSAADPAQAFGEAADAAWRGARATAGMTARRGRASYLGERAVGVPDPGAVGIGLLFSSATGPVAPLEYLLH
jgi:dihydroxyacetone kinase-like protein